MDLPGPGDGVPGSQGPGFSRIVWKVNMSPLACRPLTLSGEMLVEKGQNEDKEVWCC